MTKIEQMFFISSIFFLIMSIFVSSSLPQDAIHWLPLNDTSGATDYIGSWDMSETGTVSHITNTSQCKVGGCVFINLGSFYTANRNDNLTAFTSCQWYKATTKDRYDYLGITKYNADAGSGDFIQTYISAWSVLSNHNGTNDVIRTSAGIYNTGYQYLDSMKVGDWHFICNKWDGKYVSSWLNGSIQIGTYLTDAKSQGTMADYSGAVRLGKADTFGDAIGFVDESFFYGRNLTVEEMKNIWQLSGGNISCSYDEWNNCLSGNQPPVITNVSQVPENGTVLNIIQTGLNISANITDLDLNVSSIRLDLIVNKSKLYVNGSLYPQNENITFYSNTTTKYYFYLDESDLLQGTYNLPHELFENTTHDYIVLSSANQLIKMEFLNVSPYIQQSFYEVMDLNNTATVGTSDYFYCNENYVDGNIIVSPYCTLFYTSPNNLPINHTHFGGKSFHRIIPLNINTTGGTINNIPITSKSYIIKRGDNAGNRLYYINNTARNTATAYSSNLGVSYTSESYTIDAHIHQINGTAFNYKICAKDEISQETCTGWYSGQPTYPSFAPTQVIFISPVANITYSGILNVSHTNSVGQTYPIINYSYYITIFGSGVYDLIGFNYYPMTNLSFNTSVYANTDYMLRVDIKDSIGQLTQSYSDRFTIYNTPFVSPPIEIYINFTGLETQLKNFNENNLLFIFVGLLAIFLLTGIMTKEFVTWIMASVCLMAIGSIFGIKAINNYGDFNFNIVMAVTFVILSVISVLLTLYMNMKQSESKEEKNNLYNIYNK